MNLFTGNVARVEISSGGALQTAEFKGRVFTRDVQAFYKPEELGWTDADWAEAKADPRIVISLFDEQNRVLKSPGVLAPVLDDKPRRKKEQL